MNGQRRFLLSCLVATMALTGCGGGGNGSVSSMNLAPSLTRNIENNPPTMESAQTAAAAIPVEGSVTQSSEVNAATGVTLDEITAEAEYSNGELQVSVTNGRTSSWDTVGSGDVVFRSNDLTGTNTGDTYRQRTLGKEIGDGGVIVDIFTNRLSDTDTDYLVGGVWLFIPGDADMVDDVEIGAFADGPDASLTPAAYLQTTGTATYEGDATGVYVGTDVDGAFVGEIVADVALTAALQPTNPTIGGTLTNFAEIDASRSVLTPLAGSPTLTLGTAPIAAAAGGFFTGDTSGTQEVDGTTHTYTGKWGGQFYGSEANLVGGTFGGSTDNQGYQNVFVGAFGAEKQ